MSDKIQVFKHTSQSQMDEEVEIDLVELFKLFWKRKRLIFSLTTIFAICSLAYALYLPFIYKAESKIMLPNQGSGGRLASLTASLGGLASFAGLPQTATSGQMLIGVLETNSVVDKIIKEFDLENLYSIDIMINLRTATLKNLQTNEDTKSGIITVGFLDEDPQRAADITNAFVRELQKKMREVSFSSAQENRIFYETQLKQAQEELNKAEQAMLNYQQSSGVIEYTSQAKALLEAIARLREQIAAKNVEISSLRSYARRDNPRLKVAQSQLEAMTKELNRLEEEQKKSDTASSRRNVSADAYSVGQITELGIEYQRRYRELQFANSKYEIMLQQYESARLSEANDISTISILDYATPPDYKFKPSRAQICIVGTMLGFMLSLAWIFGKEFIRNAKENNENNNDDSDYDYEE